MILLDANLLLYAHDSKATEHQRARFWLEQAFSGMEKIGLSWVTVLAFLRIATSKCYESNPMSTSDASAIVESWMTADNISLVGPTERHWRIFTDLLSKSHARGPLIMDAISPLSPSNMALRFAPTTGISFDFPD